MAAFASSANTWGVSGQAWLLGYAVLALAVLVGVLAARRRIAAEWTGTPAAADLERRPHDAAYLNGGPELAVLSALSSMHVSGTIVADGRGRVSADARASAGAGELERAIHLAAAAPISRQRLATNRIVHTALDNIRRRLTEAGLLLSRDQQSRVKGTGGWLAAVAGIGLLRLLAGVANGAPVGFLVLELLVVGVIAAILMSRAPRRTPRGDMELERLRKRHTELDPGMRPTGWHTDRPTQRSEWGSSVPARCGRPTLRSRRRCRSSGLRRCRPAPAASAAARTPGLRAAAGTQAGAGDVGAAAAAEGDRLPPSQPEIGPLLGIGWRRSIAGLIADLPGLRFCEVIAESLPAAHWRCDGRSAPRRRRLPRLQRPGRSGRAF